MIVGIDVGKQGGIVALNNGAVYQRFIVPTIGTSIDVRKFVEIMKQFEVIGTKVLIEDIHAIFGASAKATFSFGHVAGVIEGIVCSLGLSYSLVQPKTWQKVAFQCIPEQRKPSTVNKNGVSVKGKIDTKKMALVAQNRLFPCFDSMATPRCSTPHDGLIDALLIAYYGEHY